MKKTPLKRGTKQMARSGFKRKPTTKKRRVKSPLQKAKIALWEHCKRITRARCVQHDGTWICYSCGSLITEPRSAHTGHFIPSSTSSVHMRYHLDNLRVQCYDCNINKNGHWTAFEAHLILDGIDPDELKKLNEETKGESYREDWYLAKIQEYEQM